MQSPFPGMDPYLERHWLEVHHRLVTYTGDLLQECLPSDLRARIEERVFVEIEPSRGRNIFPDVHVAEPPRTTAVASLREAADAVALAEPLILVAFQHEPLTQGYVEIVDVASGGRVVTAIEYVSPSNKHPGQGREMYLRKQAELVEGGVNLVEIDLTRSGERVLRVPAWVVPESYRTTYQVCVSRSTRREAVEIYRVPLRERLPVIRIPLRPSDPDVPLDLQSLVDASYAKGRYDASDYRLEPVPPLDADDAAWAQALLRQASLR